MGDRSATDDRCPGFVVGVLRAISGPTLDAPRRGEVRERTNALVEYDQDGVITSVLVPEDEQYAPTKEKLRDSGHLETLAEGVFLIPGMVDLHIHAPQWPQLGKALDVPLEVWLNRYTFPLEARYEDLAFAAESYTSLVPALLRNGTTTGVYFGTVHRSATQLLADVCLKNGQRAVIGKVAMDHPDGCPEYYRDDDATTAIAETRQFVEYVQGHLENAASLVLPAVTPRFVPSCTDAALSGLGDLAQGSGCHVQTHCSESDWAHRYGLERFGRSDTATYQEFGLLGRHTVLAHSNFIDEADMGAIVAAGASVAHCPRSNAFFANAVFPARRALDLGVHVGLGTDISGGPSPSVFDSAAWAVGVSRMREDGVDPGSDPSARGVAGSRITFAEAFWMGTAGGGQALDLPIGLLEPGYKLDALAIDSRAAGSNLDIWPELDSTEDVVQKVIHGVGPSCIGSVWVDGRKVVSSG